MNALANLYEKQKQSFWLDYIQRSLITSGELKRMVDEDGMRGMTSNPTIFQKAFSTGSEYDALLKKAAGKGKSIYSIFEEVAIQDIQKAADVLKPVYKSSGGRDGFVSLEVNPKLAFDAQGTLEEAKKLWKKVNRPNLMIKIPGTQEGLNAIEDALAAGVNINITLLFSVEIYKKVLESYLKALERRAKKGQPLKNIASVASFFVSRVDTIIDKQLDQIISEGGSNAVQASKVLHKIAVANAKIAYAHYTAVVNSSRFKKLESKGAQRQRLLWASTGTKDKRLSDVFYIDELIGPDTVNTMPPQTAVAFKDHGQVQKTLTQDLEAAKKSLEQLAELGISLDQATSKLQKDGVKSFIDSFNDLLQVVAAKTELLTDTFDKNYHFSIRGFESDVEQMFEESQENNWVKRIWSKDPTLWKDEEAHTKIISNSLGWLKVPQLIQEKLGWLTGVINEIRKGKFTHALLLGMGGSSLCPEVLRLTFGKKPGYPDLAILDSTEPASVMERAKRSKPEKTLYIVASKSGSTSEPNAFLAYFYDQVKKKKGTKAGENFVAITDPNTHLADIAQNKKFRHTVLNPSDIGGRYSALSFFGMFPAALMGINVERLIEGALKMMAACSYHTPNEKNPGLQLGITLGVLAKAGKDKLTFVLSKEIGSFSTWIEQLVAESTGKEGKGILPIESEDLKSPQDYLDDRVFVYIKTKSDKDKKTAARIKSLQKAGHPVLQLNLGQKEDLGGQFFLWEFATGVAGKVLGINPFDQPNVQEAKDLTKEYLAQFRTAGKFEEEAPHYKDPTLMAYSYNGSKRPENLSEVIKSHLQKVGAHDYVAILAYLRRDSKNWAALQAIRKAIQDITHAATTLGFGPRFLHSTGQLHKGGANNGVFISITADDPNDLPIPGEPFKFSVLKEAQARGDWSALKNKGRRILHIHLHNQVKGLAQIKEILSHIN